MHAFISKMEEIPIESTANWNWRMRYMVYGNGIHSFIRLDFFACACVCAFCVMQVQADQLNNKMISPLQ